MELLDFYNYKRRLHLYVSKLISFICTINVPLPIGKCTPGWEHLHQILKILLHRR